MIFFCEYSVSLMISNLIWIILELDLIGRFFSQLWLDVKLCQVTGVTTLGAAGGGITQVVNTEPRNITFNIFKLENIF